MHFFKILFRERESMCERVHTYEQKEGQRQRERILSRLHAQHRVQPTQGSISRPRDGEIKSQTFHQWSHPRAP